MEVGQAPLPYYAILGVSMGSSVEEIKRAYRRLAMQWHPDRWTRTPSLLGEANRKFQQIQEAYSVLSDQRKKTMYDAGLYDQEDEEDEDFSDFMREMATLIGQARRENKIYSIGELQKMFMEMAQGFESTSWCYGPSVFEESGRSKRARWDSNPMADTHSKFGVPGLATY